MKKALFRKLRGLSNKVLGEEKTNKIIEETAQKTITEFLEETKPKKKKSDSE